MNVTDVSAHKIDGQVWAAATATWELGAFTLIDEDQFVHAINRYETRVLAALDQDEAPAVTIIHGDKPGAVDYDAHEQSPGKIIDSERMARALDGLRAAEQ
jgi:hypothetical protein